MARFPCRSLRLAVRLPLLVLASALLVPPPQAAEPKAAGQDQGQMKVDEPARRISCTGRIAKQNVYKELKGAVEYLICTPGGKEYESVFVCPLELQALYDALVKIGVRPGRPASDEDGKYLLPSGGRVRIFVEWHDGKEQRRARAESFVYDNIHKQPMQDVDWPFTGSRQAKDPTTGNTIIQAVLVKNVVAVHHLDPTVLFQNPLEEAKVENRYAANAAALPKEGTPVTVIFEAAPPPKVETPAGHRRVHLLITGTVQGVGFREFTLRTARQLSLKGWVRNLPTGEVELEAEGLEAAIQELETKVGKGPRSAKVEKVQTVKASLDPLGEFEVRETPAK